eukprot:2267458-Rhodomonas_salina.2
MLLESICLRARYATSGTDKQCPLWTKQCPPLTWRMGLPVGCVMGEMLGVQPLFRYAPNQLRTSTSLQPFVPAMRRKAFDVADSHVKPGLSAAFSGLPKPTANEDTRSTMHARNGAKSSWFCTHQVKMPHGLSTIQTNHVFFFFLFCIQSGTSNSASCLRACHAVSGTAITVCSGICLGACYALSGTELGSGATRGGSKSEVLARITQVCPKLRDQASTMKYMVLRYLLRKARITQVSPYGTGKANAMRCPVRAVVLRLAVLVLRLTLLLLRLSWQGVKIASALLLAASKADFAGDRNVSGTEVGVSVTSWWASQMRSTSRSWRITATYLPPSSLSGCLKPRYRPCAGTDAVQPHYQSIDWDKCFPSSSAEAR